MNRQRRILLLLPVCCLFFTACNASESLPISKMPQKRYVYAMVVKDIHNPYMLKAFEGFREACRSFEADAIMEGPEIASSEKQLEVIRSLVDRQVDLIAVAANDKDALQKELIRAKKMGIKVLSFDSAVNAESRQLNVKQASSETIGRVLVQAAYRISEGNGGVAILSSTKQATNQNEWIQWIKTELNQNFEKYSKMPLVSVVYGDDNLEISKEKCRLLLQNPDVRIIIAPTVVGLLAAAQCISETGQDVLLTGLGLPTEMADYIESGICPLMFIWNPIDLGYLTAYSGDALVKGRISGTPGDVFSAGRMGEMVVVEDSVGGSEVIMGDPFKYDQINISEWKDVF